MLVGSSLGNSTKRALGTLRVKVFVNCKCPSLIIINLYYMCVSMSNIDYVHYFLL